MLKLNFPANKQSLVIVVVAVVTIAIWLNIPISNPKLLTVTFMDVGEGLCTVVKAPSGKLLVMDCGTSSWRNSKTIGSSLVAPFLQKQGYDSIDVAVLSHPHADHVSGFARLLEEKPAKLVLDTGTKHGSHLYMQFLKAVKKSGARYRIARRGQSIDLGDGVCALVLNPDPLERSSNLNDESLGLRITYKKVAVLLAGDMGNEAEDHVIQSGLPLRAQVLQVGHHGSSTSSSLQWLSKIRPAVAVISCGRNNEYGHPSIDTIDRIQSVGARIYRTDKHGAVTITSDGNKISVRAQKTYR